jgi:hypothetical protein
VDDDVGERVPHQPPGFFSVLFCRAEMRLHELLCTRLYEFKADQNSTHTLWCHNDRAWKYKTHEECNYPVHRRQVAQNSGRT